MLASLKSELRKFLTVRSTYIMTVLVLGLIAFLAVYAFGYKQDPASLATSSTILSDAISGAVGIFAIFAAILVILLVTHEYRYNTITYTLTTATNRLYVLASKLIVSLVYVTVIGLVVAAIAYFGTKAGIAASGGTLRPQDLPTELVWQILVYLWGNILFAFVIAVLARSVVVAMGAFFVIPVVESILSGLLKANAEFLPFQALNAVIGQALPTATLTNSAAAVIVAIYVIVFGTLAAVLFVRRDAN